MKYSKEDIISAIREAKGVLTVAASILDCDRSTIYKRMQNDEDIKEAHEQASEVMLDQAENALYDLIDSDKHKDHWKAVRYLLSTKGKKRGYVERQEITGEDGNEIKVSFVDAD